MAKKTSDAVKILKSRYSNTKEAAGALEEARTNSEIARRIYKLRNESGFTQAELAKLVGTSRTVITRLEDDDYDGHSLSMLRRVAGALNKRIEIRFVAIRTSERAG